MRMLMKIAIPNEPFNTLQKEGRAGQIITRILEATTPEAMYFATENGQRGGVMIVNIDSESELPSVAEPWFLSFNASIEAQVCMTPEDLGAAGLEAIAKQWR